MPNEKHCQACENRRMVTRGTFPGGRVRWVTCSQCDGSGPVACTQADHDHITASLPLFLAFTSEHQDWPDAGLIIGNCLNCSSTLAVVGKLAQTEVAA